MQLQYYCAENGGLLALSSGGTLYVALRLTPESVLDLTEFVNGVPVVDESARVNVKSDSFHCTVMYSENSQVSPREFVQGTRPLVLRARMHSVTVYGPPEKQVVVGELDSQDIKDFHSKVASFARWDSEFDYNPHVTLFKLDGFSESALAAWQESANEQLLHHPVMLELFSPIATTLK